MTDHTPGPWESRHFNVLDHDRAYGVVSQHDGKSSTVAFCYGSNSEADACLIAAAPETAVEHGKLREINAELLTALHNCLFLVKLKFGVTDLTAAAVIKQADDAIVKGRPKQADSAA